MFEEDHHEGDAGHPLPQQFSLGLDLCQHYYFAGLLAMIRGSELADVLAELDAIAVRVI